jgi:hypothetical protein
MMGDADGLARIGGFPPARAAKKTQALSRLRRDL